MEEYALRQPELVGRDQELGKLKQSLQNALEGKGSTIFIAGEAGIGKTRLGEYHRLIADTIAEIHSDNPDDVVGDLAYHYFKAGDEKAGNDLRRNGQDLQE